MFGFNAARFWIVLAAVIFAWSLQAQGQDPTPEQNKFWEDFQKVYQTGDSEATLKFVRRNRDPAPDTFEFYFIHFVMNGPDAVDPECLKALAGYMEIALKNSYYLYKIEFYLELDQGSQESWGRAWNHYIAGFLAYIEATEQDNPYKLDEAQGSFKQARKIFAFIKDKLAESDLVLRLAETAEAFEDGYQASKFYVEAIDLYDRLPDKHNEMPMTPPNEELVRNRLQEYLDKGYDPTKPRDEGGQPDLDALAAEEAAAAAATEAEFKKALFTLVAEDAAETWPLKFGAMKKPDEFVTPAYDSAFNPLTWSKFWFDSVKAEGGQQFVPFFATEYFFYGFYNKPLNLTAEKNKFYLDIDGNKRTRVQLKATTKPTKLAIKDVEKGPDGKPREYQFFFAAQGDKEVMFGMEQNNAVPDPKMISLRVRCGCYMKGKVLGENIVLIDDNCTGAYGDNNRPEMDGITDGSFPYWRLDAMQVGREKKARPFSQCMQFGGKWYWLTWEHTGDTLKTAEVDVATGTLSLDWSGELFPTFLVLHLIDDECPNFFIDVANPDGPVELPIGDYEIACGKIETLKKGQSKQVRIYQGESKAIQVYENKETVLKMGAPYKFTFDTESLGNEYTVVGKSIKVWGRLGELYTVFFDEVPQPTLSIRDKGSGKVLLRNEKMRLAALENYWEDYMCVWYPLDYLFENKMGGDLEARLEAKKMKMLGGPASSEWQ